MPAIAPPINKNGQTALNAAVISADKVVNPTFNNSNPDAPPAAAVSKATKIFGKPVKAVVASSPDLICLSIASPTWLRTFPAPSPI